MTEYRIPEQPDVSTVWDGLGKEWGYVEQPHTGGWVWENSLTGEVIDWDELLHYRGPLRDYPPEPAHGTRWVDKNGGVWEWRRNEHGAALHSPECGDDCSVNDGWENSYRLIGPLTPYVGPEPDPDPDPDPWEAVKPGRLYWVTGRDKFQERDVSGIAFGSSIRGESVDYLNGDGWTLWRSERAHRIDSVVPLTAVPTHLLDALIETAVDYYDPEDDTSVLREAVYDVTDWLADHTQNKETK